MPAIRVLLVVALAAACAPVPTTTGECCSTICQAICERAVACSVPGAGTVASCVAGCNLNCCTNCQVAPANPSGTPKCVADVGSYDCASMGRPSLPATCVGVCAP